MTLYHKCGECRICPECFHKSCRTSFPPIKDVVEDGYLVRRCPDCGNIIEKFPTLETIKNREFKK